MKTRKRLSGPMAMALMIGGWILAASMPARAGYLVESPTGVGTLTVTNASSPNPTDTLTQGGSTLLNFSGSPDSGGSSAESILKYDLSSLEPGTQITSAIFTFTVADALAGLGSATESVAGFGSSDPSVVLSDFLQSSMTLGGTGPLANMPSPGLNETFTINATSLIQSLINDDVSSVGFLTTANTPGGGSVALYGDASHGASFAPALSVTYAPSSVPEPSSLVHGVLGGLIGLAASRARSRRSA